MNKNKTYTPPENSISKYNYNSSLSMKATLLSVILLFLSMSIFSQTLDYNKVDDFTGTHIIKTKGWKGQIPKKADRLDQNSHLYISMSYIKTKENDEYFALTVFLFNVGDMGCFSEYDGKAMLLLESGETLTFKQNSDTNCDTNFYSVDYLMLSEEQSSLSNWREAIAENFEVLASSKVKKIRVYATKGYKDFEIIPDKEDYFAKHALLLKDNLQ